MIYKDMTPQQRSYYLGWHNTYLVTDVKAPFTLDHLEDPHFYCKGLKDRFNNILSTEEQITAEVGFLATKPTLKFE